MKYSELFMHSWQIARHNKRIWFFSFWSTLCSMIGPLFTMLIRSPDLKTLASLSLPLSCWIVILSLAYLILFAWSLYGVFYCTALAVNGVECETAAVWKNFKSNFLKMAFLGIFLAIYSHILYGLNKLVIWPGIISLASNLYGSTFWWNVSFGVLIILLGAPIALSFYGLIFQKMGAIASFINGIGVFSKDPMTFIGIGSIQYLAVLVGGLTAFVSLLFLRQNISYENYNSMRSAIPITILTSFCSFFIEPVLRTAVASRYFKVSPLGNNPVIS